MYQFSKSGHSSSPKPTQHSVMQIVKNNVQLSQPHAHVNRNVRSTNNTPQIFKTSFPKNNSSISDQNETQIIKNIKNAHKHSTAKSENPPKANAQVIFHKSNRTTNNNNINTNKNNISTQKPKMTATKIVQNYVQKTIQKSNVTKQPPAAQNVQQQKSPLVDTSNIVKKQCINNDAPPPKVIVNAESNENPQLSSKKDVLQLYSRAGPMKPSSPTSPKKADSNPLSLENLNFQDVTQELTSVIKNLQKQIREVSSPKNKTDEFLPEMLQPKIKEFFKSVQKQPANNTSSNKNSSKNPTNSSPSNDKTNSKNQINSGNNQLQSQIVYKQCSLKNLRENNSKNQTNSRNNQPQGGIISKQSSLRSFSKNSTSCKNGDVRRFRSFTQHELQMQQHSSSNGGVTNRASSLGVDPLKQLKEEVQKAIRAKKTFTIRGYFQTIRKALVERGWVEKYHISYKNQLKDEFKRYQNYTISELLPLTRREDLTTICRNLIKSKLLNGYQVDFYWGINDEVFKENPDKVKLTIINKLKREIFSYTNKQGLCDASKSSYWYQKNNVSKLNHPRTYSLGKNIETQSFIEDFRLTAAMSLLKWVIKINGTKECKLISPTGTIPLETFDFAVNECCKFIKRQRHEDIDTQISNATENEWKQFLDYFYKLVHYNNHFKSEGTETEVSLVKKSDYILDHLRSVNIYVDMDGIMNIWLLKPSASSRGRGIHMCRTLQYVLKVINQNPNTRYIVQKYIERPLLIYNTKFDIRQWFLISNCSPLTIWMYKECYLRFSSQTYNLRKLHESIHLTNNSVQSKYKNTSLDSALPNYNMWDSIQFRQYLSNIGYPKVFKDIIYPGMRQCITAAVLVHQEKMIIRKNCFELYGADFMLTEDFQPWLLEINASPALFASTPITAKMCPQVLADTIKVVIDHAQNSKANTGLFEMIYKEKLTKFPPVPNLEVKGVPLETNYFCNDSIQEVSETYNPPSHKKTSLVVDQAQDCLKTFGEEIKKTLKNLLQIIHNEKLKRSIQNHKTENLESIA